MWHGVWWTIATMVVVRHGAMLLKYGATAERMMDLARCVFLERGGERYRVPTYVKKFAAGRMVNLETPLDSRLNVVSNQPIWVQ